MYTNTPHRVTFQIAENGPDDTDSPAAARNLVDSDEDGVEEADNMDENLFFQLRNFLEGTGSSLPSVGLG